MVRDRDVNAQKTVKGQALYSSHPLGNNIMTDSRERLMRSLGTRLR